MIVYHGSNANFKKLRIAKSLVHHSTTFENEDMGIYFSTDRKVAESYGHYVYKLKVNDEVFWDFRKEKDCALWLNHIADRVFLETKIYLFEFLNPRIIIQDMLDGSVAFFNLGDRTIYLYLDSDENWYRYTTETQRQKIYRVFRKCDKELKAYMFSYCINNIGIIKDVSNNTVQIIEKTN